LKLPMPDLTIHDYMKWVTQLNKTCQALYYKSLYQAYKRNDVP